MGGVGWVGSGGGVGGSPLRLLFSVGGRAGGESARGERGEGRRRDTHRGVSFGREGVALPHFRPAWEISPFSHTMSSLIPTIRIAHHRQRMRLAPLQPWT